MRSTVAMVLALTLVMSLTTAVGAAAQERHYTVELVSANVFADFGGDLEVLGEYRRFTPEVIVAYVGDTVTIEFTNKDEYLHAFGSSDFDVRTDNLAQDESATVSFVVDQPGVFTFRCRLRRDAEQRHCTPDHRTQIGYILVLER